MNLFDILGPVMVGPSSSHTAGAVRIGYIARKLLQETPVKVEILLHGSFATTGVGHGTDRALIAGLLGMKPDDIRIPHSFELAKESGLAFSFGTVNLRDAHPNTAVLKLVGESGKEMEVQGVSIGGGRVLIQKLNGMEVNFSGERNTLVIQNLDTPGSVAKVTSILFWKSVNIATMQLCRDKRGGYAMMVLETDEEIWESSVRELQNLDGVLQVIYLGIEKE
ncbi:MAG: L-serine ammonia-lyase, iron-sulfur-dependent, subunit beta [Lachnospiraceae bacterium]|nr:L-serine ammonia-lyase, iron-sulfur-dependent, subunit beta [Lachnospiraceae bacterium]